MVDVIAWRAYSAEHSLPPQSRLPDFAAVTAFANRVLSSQFWHRLVPHEHEVVVTEAPFDDHESYLQRDRPFQFLRADLAIHPEMRWELNILHELAHGACPHYHYAEPGRDRRKPWPAHCELHPHGDLWVATLLLLVDEFLPEQAVPLRAAYEHYGIRPIDDAEFESAVVESHRAEAELADWVKQATNPEERSWGLMMIAQQQDCETVAWAKRPTIVNVLLAKAAKIEPRKRGIDALFDPVVALVSPVIECTAADLEEICQHDNVLGLRTIPDPGQARRLTQIATAAMIALNVDPIFMFVHLGLTPMSGDVTETEAEQLNSAWLNQVKTMNTLSEERPSRWGPATLGEAMRPLPTLRSARESIRWLLRTRAAYVDMTGLKISRDEVRYPDMVLSVDDVLDRLRVLQVPADSVQIAIMKRADRSTYFEIQISQPGTDHLAGIYPALATAVAAVHGKQSP